jgi:hypothetical protein
MANSKLEREQKEILKELKAGLHFPGNWKVTVTRVSEVTTLAWADRGNTIAFSLAVMSPDEEKFRRKVGEYWALSRFYDGEVVKMGREDFSQMCSSLWEYEPL